MFKFPDKMIKVFRDAKHQEEFEKNGFIILPFYNNKEIKDLEELYYRLHPKDEKGFFPSTFSGDKNYRTVADVDIRRICDRSIKQYCENVKVVCGCFIVKSPGPESGMCVHQDMSLVDESRFTGINIWVPLVDLTIENGALFVLPGSHRLFPTYRGSSIPEFFQDVNNNIIDYLKPVLIKAGEAVFFDQSIIHYSPPNYSDKVRIVTNTYFTHKDTEFRTYYFDKTKPGSIEEFIQDDSFMTDFQQFGENIHDRPKVGKSLGFTEYNFPKIDTSFLDKNFIKTNARELIQNAVPKEPEASQSEKKSIFKRVIELIS